MRKLLSLSLLILPVAVQANCKIVLHKNASDILINRLISYKVENNVLRDSQIIARTEKPDFGIKESVSFKNTGKKDVFGENIQQRYSQVSIYQAGKVVYQNQKTSDYGIIVKEIVDQFMQLGCH